MEKADAMKEFCSPNCFGILQDDIQENDHDLNKNYLIDNNSDSNKDNEKTVSNRNTKVKAPTMLKWTI